jgi:YggT family protein
MDVIIGPVFRLLIEVLHIYMWIVIIGVAMSWLVAFNVINTRNRFVHMVLDITYRLTEPLLRPIRRILPNMGGLDLSPMVLILLIWFVQDVLAQLMLKFYGL